MRRTSLLALAAVLFLTTLGAALPGAERESPPAARRPNIVVLSVDSLRKASLRQDDPRLPNLNRLLRSSVVLDSALSPAPWTLPAHASLMTGLYPDRHGATHPDLRMAPDLPVLALSLWQAGYETVAFTDKGFLDRQFGFGRGFQRYDDRAVATDPRLGAALPRGGDFNGQPGLDLFDRALTFLRYRGQNRSGRPFFLFLHTFGLHDYFFAHPWATSSLPPHQDPPPTYYLDCLAGVKTCTAGDWRRMEALYEAEVAHMDRALGLLLQALEDSGLRESTLFVFTSDHGEGFDVGRQRIHHGGRLHRDMLEVPLLISGPGLLPRRIAEPVSLVDLFPTLLDLAGAPVPPGLDGVSLASALRGGARPPARTFYAMEHFLWWQGPQRYQTDAPRKSRIGIAAITDADWYIQSRSGEELYDVRSDPEQIRNLAPKGARAAKLRDKVRGKGNLVQGLLRREDSKSLEDQLRSLGYLR